MYITYHSQTVQAALVAGGSLNAALGFRSTHLDKVTINADGSIAPITGTYQGVPQQGPIDPHGRIEAETIAWDSGIQDAYVDSSGIRVVPVGSASTGEQKLTNINDGEWTSLAKVDFGGEASGGAGELTADVLPKAGGKVEIRLNSPDTSSDANLVGTLTVPASSGDTWTKVSTTFSTRVTGVHNVFFVFKSTATSELFDVDDWQFKFDRLTGFYQPVDMNAVNTAKGGSTIPLKFEVFAGSVELSALSEIASITYAPIPGDGSAPTDEIETVATGGTSLTYNTTAGVYQYNWKTPTTPGNYRVTVKTRDGATLTADFRLR
jgi:hypothetical protein